MAPLRGGTNWVKRAPVFSSDGKFLLVCTGATVSVLAVSTGQRVAELKGHTDLVTCIVVAGAPPGTQLSITRAWTCSLDGSIRLWNFLSGMQIRRLEFDVKMMSMVIPSTLNQAPGDVMAYISVVNSDRSGRVALYNLSQNSCTAKVLAETARSHDLAISLSGNVVATIDDRKVLLWRTDDEEHSSYSLSSKKRLVCVALDPTGTLVAAGNVEGRILIWKNVRAGSEETVAVYHWHPHAVRFLTISSDGSYLLSGGMEKVLVLWHISTAKQQFIPRLGSPLVHVAASPDPAVFAICSADNVIRYVNIGSRKLEKVHYGIKPIAHRRSRKDIITKVMLEPQSGRLALPSMNASLQIYDAVQDQHAAEVVVSAFTHNVETQKDEHGKVVVVDFEKIYEQTVLVTHVAFSADGSVMITADAREGEEDIGRASSLKFWNRKPGASPFVLHTQVDDPHQGKILGLACHPVENMVATCSDGRDFKLWVLNEDKSSTTRRWKCDATGSYRQKAMHAVAFSADGSLLAVSAEEAITLWNPKTNGLVCVLAQCPPAKETVRLMAFDSSNRYLVTAYFSQRPVLTVWSLATLSVCWAYHAEVLDLAVDPEGACFAILVSGTSNPLDAFLCVFNPESPQPVAAWSLPFGRGGALVFVPKKHIAVDDENDSVKHSNLVVFNRDREYMMFDPYEDAGEEMHGEQKVEPYTPLQAISTVEAMYGSAPRRRKQQQGLTAAMDANSTKPWGNLLDAPSHVLPPLTKVGFQLLDSLLQKCQAAEV